MKRVSILGCGWVGNALNDVLNNHYQVHCLSRDIELNTKNGLYECDILVIAIPPRDNYLEVLQQTLVKIEVSTQIIHLSSISFYSGKPLVIEAESLVKKLHQGSVILRLGGLMGYDRIAGKYTAGKTLDVNSRTNYIHRDDVIGIIECVIRQNIHDEIFDVVAPQQATKEEMFSQNARMFGFKKTKFLSMDGESQTFSQCKIYEVLNYCFLKEDVLTFWV